MSYVAFISYKHSPSSRLQAECLEAALKQYSKPWWKPPIAIFRDERVLRPGDDLPAGIRKALGESDYFVYLASKDAADSDWVRDELRIWCEDLNRSQRLLIAHIADQITTNPSTGDIVWEETDALPATLQPFVTSIPLWSELSWASTPEQRDLNNVDYKKEINAMTAKFRGKTPGEMNDEQVLTYRRNILLRNIGIGVVVACALIATFFGIEALFDRNAARASEQKAILSQQAAEKSAFEANQQKVAAQTANGIAQDQRRLADQRASIALSRQLAAQAVSMRADQLDTSLLIGAAAHQAAPTPEARDALLTVLTQRPHFDRYLRRKGGFTRLAFDQAGTLALDGGKGRVALLDSETLGDREILVGGTSVARGVAVSPNGQWVAALDETDNSLELWSVDQPRSPRSIKVGFGGFFGLDIAHGSAGYSTGPCPIAFTGNNRGILYVAPSMKLAFQANGSNEAAVEFQTGRDMNGDHRIGAVGSSASGTLVGAISTSTVFIWELDHPLFPMEVLNAPGSKGLRDFVFLRSGGIAALGDDGEVFVWEKLDDKSPRQFSAHAVSGAHIAVSADGKWLATAGAEKGSSIAEEAATAKIWYLGSYGIGNSPAATFALTGNHTFSLSFSGDSRTLATTSETGFAEFWDIEEPEPIATRLLRPDGTPVVASALAAYRDRPGLVVADSGKGILEVSKDSITSVVLPMDPQTSSTVNGAALVTDSLLAVRTPRTISLWDLDRKAVSGSLHPSDANESFYGPFVSSTDYLVTASSSGRDGKARFIGATEWHLDKQPIPRRLLAPNGWGFNRFAISPNRDRLFTGTTYQGVVSSLDFAEGTPSLNRLFTFDVEVTDIAVTGDGRYLYTAHLNGDVLRTSIGDGGKTEMFLSGAAGKEPRLALSSAGGLLAIGNESGDISLWSTVSQERNGPLLRYSDTPRYSLSQFDSSESVDQLAFIDGQNRLIVRYSKGVVVTWDLRIDQWVKYALRMAGRSLTDDERQRFLGDAVVQPRQPSKQPVNAENAYHPKDVQESCYQGFIEQSFEPLGCSDSLRSLVDRIIKSRPDDSDVCSAYALVLTKTPVLLSGLQREWARGEITNKTILTPAAISVLALTGEVSEAGFLRKSIARDTATPIEFALSQWAQGFLERLGRDTSLDSLRSISAPGSAPYQQFLAWPKCEGSLVPWRMIDPIRSGRAWPDLKVAKFDIHNASAIAYKFLAPGKERYTVLSSIGEVLADEKAPEARRFGEAALRLAPPDAQTQNVAGLIEQRLGDLDAAAAHFTESAALGPHDGWPVFNLAQLSDRRGDLSTAEREFQEALTRSKFSDGHNDRAEFLNGYAWFLYTHRSSDTGSMRFALTMAKESNKLGEFQDYEHLDTLAAIDFTLGDFVDAVSFERSAVRLSGRLEDRDSEINERLAKFEQRLRAGVELPQDEPNNVNSRIVDVNQAERACKESIRVYQAKGDGTYNWLSDNDIENFSHYYSSKQNCVASLPHAKLSSLARLSWQAESTESGSGKESGIACSCMTQ